MIEQNLPQELISNTKNAIDGFDEILKATGSLPSLLSGLSKLSSSLGIVGGLVGLVYAFIGGTNPDIAKLQ